MVITEVRKDKKHLVKITLEGGEVFFLHEDTFSQYPLHKGENITREKILELAAESDYQSAKARALWYLDQNSHTKKGLYDKLIRAKFSKESCDRVIERFCELSLIDDMAFARRYALRCAESNISKRQTYAKLMAKGVPRDIICQVLEETEVDETAQIRAVIDKKYKNKLDTRENVSKVYAALIRKGFSYIGVRDTLKNYCEELRYLDV